VDKRSAIEVVARFRREIEARGVRPTKIILYGSYAVGANREGSDIDIIIISDDFSGMSYWQRIDVLTDAIYEIFAPIEATALTQEEWERGDSLVVELAKNGEVLFAA